MSYEIAQEIDSNDLINVELSLFDIAMRIKQENVTTVYGWSIGGSVVCEVRVVGNVAYFGACDKNFYALDVNTGKELWRFTAGDVIWNFDIKRDRIFIACHDGCIYAITTKGKLVWKYQTYDKISCRPTVAKDRIYFVSKEGQLRVLDIKTGKLVWNLVDDSPSCGDPLVVNDTIYIGFNSGNCYAINYDGSVKWKFTANAPVDSAAYHNGIIFLPTIAGTLYALNEKGSVVWKFTTNNKFLTWKPPLIHEDVIYISSIDDMVYAITIEGKLLWKFVPESEVVTHPFIVGENAYFGSIGGNLYCVNKKTGNQIFKKDTSGKIIVTKNYSDRIYFSCYDCKVICTDLKGNKKWIFNTSIGTVSPVRLDPIEEKTETKIMDVLPLVEENIELYKSEAIIQERGSESIYSGLNLAYTGSSKYKAKFKYGK